MKWVFAVLLFVGISCSRESADFIEESSVSFSGKIVPQDVYRRTWKFEALEKDFVIPNAEYTELYRPADLKVDSSGNLYILDFSDYSVKEFDPRGRFVANYGNGFGTGPGEIQAMMDVGFTDSTVFILDDTNRRINYYLRHVGAFLSDRPMGDKYTMTRMSRIAKGVDVALIRRNEGLFLVQEGDSTRVFGTFVTNQVANYQVLAGRLDVVGKDFLYLPSYLPRLYRFSVTGDLRFARGTIDERDYSRQPLVETARNGSAVRQRARGYLLNGHVIVDDGLAFVHSRADSTRSWSALDAYDLDSGDYRWSIRVPEFSSYAYKRGDRVFSLTDSLVTVYRLR